MFIGFSADTLKFFRDLSRHNKKEWYLKNKDRYQTSVVDPARELAARLVDSRPLKKIGLRSREKNPLFRLHRDTRFSADKSPLKTYNGMTWTRSGARGDSGVLYLHLEPGECFLAAGFWQPDPPLLTRFRLNAVEDPSGSTALLKKLAKAKLDFGSEESLKRLPRGFERIEAPEMQRLLRLRHWVVSEKFRDSELLDKKLPERIEEFATRAAPLLQWGWPILDQWRREGGDEAYQERLNAKL